MADDIEGDAATGDLPGLTAVHTYLLAKVLGNVCRAGVIEADPQGDDERAIRLRRQLRGDGLDRNLRDLRRHLLEVVDGGSHIGDGRIGPGRGDQRQRGGAVITEPGLHRVMNLQRLRTGDLETTTGELFSMTGYQARRGGNKNQPDSDRQPPIPAKVVAGAHHD
ncbi:Uncharacterised protein [Mycobacteroides abscessus subsp. massiliense]|nr:Uncharacterised protein [Mycobacteroides abscessus subsp. massiliense]